MREQRRLAAILAADVAGYSRLMGVDEVGTMRALKAHRRDLFDPQVALHRGRVVNTAGDGVLVEFASVVDAVNAAIAIQRAMTDRNADLPEDRRIRFRVGINLGDVIVDDREIAGDGVNLAARLEALSEPGGICISGGVHEQVRDRIPARFTDLGEQIVKNIARPVRVYGLGAADLAALPPIGRDDTGAAESAASGLTQQIRYCRGADGVQLAWSVMGEGPYLVKTGNWMTHLEKDLESPIWQATLRDLIEDYSLVRYDARGCGLSDRSTEDISFDAFLRDLETVVDAAGIERFALLGISQGCAVSIAYAAAHPERVSHLVLYGGFAQGYDKVPTSPAMKERRAAMLTLMRHGWGKSNPAYRQLFTSQLMPEATKEQADWFNEMERITSSPENAVKFMMAIDQFDVAHLLPKVKAPTLVLHASGEVLVPFEAGRRMAAGIPGARLVKLDSRNHIILESEPAYEHFINEIKAFLRT